MVHGAGASCIANPVQTVLLLAAVSPVFLDAFQRVMLLWNNAPGRLATINTFKSYEVKFADKTRNCEDALIIESKGIAIVGCDPGRERYNTVMVSLYLRHTIFPSLLTIVTSRVSSCLTLFLVLRFTRMIIRMPTHRTQILSRALRS